MEKENMMEYTLRFPEKLSAENVAEFEASVKEQMKKLTPETRLIMDMENLTYISSMGLRLILRLCRAYRDHIAMNIGPGVYSILELAGFTSFLPTRRKPIRIPPVEGEPIARGSNGEIYAIAEDEIVKMFTEKTSRAEIEEEWDNARTAVSLGIPSIICYAVVNDGSRNGILFEKLQTKTLDRLIYDDYEHFDTYADMFANLFRTIHETRDLRKDLSSVTKQQTALVDRAWYLTEEEREELKNFIRQIPETDTVIHGDFHPRNLGMADGELIAMDMAEIGYGHPVFDFISTYYDLVFSGKNFPEVTSFFFGLQIPDLRRLWDRMLQTYFGGLTEQETNWLNDMMDELVGLRAILLPVLHPNNTKEKHARWAGLGRERLDGKLDELLEKVRIFDTEYLHRNDNL